MLYLVGLGLYDENDLSLRAVEALKASDRVYLEGYTSKSYVDLDHLTELCGREVTVLSRADVEEKPEDNVLKPGTASLIVMGDPLVATTHSDLVLRAEKAGKEVKIIHSSSVYSAVAETGLQLYKFGKTTTIAYPEGDYFPKSPYDALWENKKTGLHTLCLLDVKAEQEKYMSVAEGLELLLKMEEARLQNQFKPDTKCVGVARLGGDTVIRYGTAKQLKREDFGGPPHILIVLGKLHFVEEEMLARFRVRKR